jgi:hypothetical protein
MASCIYISETQYVESKSTAREKIAAIEALQDALITTAMRAVMKGDITQYTLNDGQTIITTTYRNPEDINKAWQGLNTIKQMLVNTVNGRVFRLMDSKSFNGNGGR